MTDSYESGIVTHHDYGSLMHSCSWYWSRDREL